MASFFLLGVESIRDRSTEAGWSLASGGGGGGGGTAREEERNSG
jgi:hypothetical protein